MWILPPLLALGTPPPKDPSPTGSCTSLTIVSIRGTPTLCPTQTRPSARDTNGMQIVLSSLWSLSNCISYKPWVLQLWIITTGCFCSCLPLKFASYGHVMQPAAPGIYRFLFKMSVWSLYRLWISYVSKINIGVSRPCCPSKMYQHFAWSIASFPGHSHQYLIAYSMQIRRGEAWEIWSRAVTSGRQMVDTRGAVPDSSNSRFVSNCPWHCEQRMVLTLPC